jgi:membrane-associated phospholipid phosphatase
MIGLGQKPLRDVIAPKFDPRSLPFYVLLMASISLVWACLALTGVNVSRALQFDTAIWACVAIVIATMLRRVGHERLSTGMETIAVIIVMAVVLVGIQYPLAAVSGPLVDEALLRADQMIGFDWLTFARLFRDPVALAILEWSYESMSWQAAIVLAILAWRGDATRSWHFVTATFILFLAATLPFPLFPADGRFVLCGLRPADVPVVSNFCDYGPILHHLRDGSLRVIEPGMAVGMVTFPSAHTAAGLLLTWAVWPQRWLRCPFAVLNVALGIGAIVIGSHYLIDIIGGLAIGASSIWLAGKLIARVEVAGEKAGSLPI